MSALKYGHVRRKTRPAPQDPVVPAFVPCEIETAESNPDSSSSASRGEKLYVTKDKRRPTSWRRCLSWIVACTVISVVLIVAILAGTGVILSQDQNLVKEASVGRNFAGSSVTQNQLPKSSDKNNFYVPRSIESDFVIDNLNFDPALSDANSSAYHEFASSMEDQLKMILFDKRMADFENYDVGLRVVNVSRDPFKVAYRIGWNHKSGHKDDEHESQPIRMEDVKRKVIESLASNQGYLGRYHIDKERVKVDHVINTCMIDNGKCSHICFYNYNTQLFTCTCPTHLVLDSSGKNCVTWDESSEQDFLPVPNRTLVPDVEPNVHREMQNLHESASRPEPQPEPEPKDDSDDHHQHHGYKNTASGSEDDRYGHEATPEPSPEPNTDGSHSDVEAKPETDSGNNQWTQTGVYVDDSQEHKGHTNTGSSSQNNYGYGENEPSAEPTPESDSRDHQDGTSGTFSGGYVHSDSKEHEPAAEPTPEPNSNDQNHRHSSGVYDHSDDKEHEPSAEPTPEPGFDDRDHHHLTHHDRVSGSSSGIYTHPDTKEHEPAAEPTPEPSSDADHESSTLSHGVHGSIPGDHMSKEHEPAAEPTPEPTSDGADHHDDNKGLTSGVYVHPDSKDHEPAAEPTPEPTSDGQSHDRSEHHDSSTGSSGNVPSDSKDHEPSAEPAPSSTGKDSNYHETSASFNEGGHAHSDSKESEPTAEPTPEHNTDDQDRHSFSGGLLPGAGIHSSGNDHESAAEPTPEPSPDTEDTEHGKHRDGTTGFTSGGHVHPDSEGNANSKEHEPAAEPTPNPTFDGMARPSNQDGSTDSAQETIAQFGPKESEPSTEQNQTKDSNTKENDYGVQSGSNVRHESATEQKPDASLGSNDQGHTVGSHPGVFTQPGPSENESSAGSTSQPGSDSNNFYSGLTDHPDSKQQHHSTEDNMFNEGTKTTDRGMGLENLENRTEPLSEVHLSQRPGQRPSPRSEDHDTTMGSQVGTSSGDRDDETVSPSERDQLLGQGVLLSAEPKEQRPEGPQDQEHLSGQTTHPHSVSKEQELSSGTTPQLGSEFDKQDQALLSGSNTAGQTLTEPQPGVSQFSPENFPTTVSPQTNADQSLNNQSSVPFLEQVLINDSISHPMSANQHPNQRDSAENNGTRPESTGHHVPLLQDILIKKPSNEEQGHSGTTGNVEGPIIEEIMIDKSSPNETAHAMGSDSAQDTVNNNSSRPGHSQETATEEFPSSAGHDLESGVQPTVQPDAIARTSQPEVEEDTTILPKIIEYNMTPGLKDTEQGSDRNVHAESATQRSGDDGPKTTIRPEVQQETFTVPVSIISGDSPTSVHAGSSQEAVTKADQNQNTNTAPDSQNVNGRTEQVQNGLSSNRSPAGGETDPTKNTEGSPSDVNTPESAKEHSALNHTTNFPSSTTSDLSGENPQGRTNGITNVQQPEANETTKLPSDLSNNIKDEGQDNEEFNTLLDPDYKTKENHSGEGKNVLVTKYPSKGSKIEKKKLKDYPKSEKGVDDVTVKSAVTPEDFILQKHVNGNDNTFPTDYNHATGEVTVPIEGVPGVVFKPHGINNQDISVLQTVAPDFRTETVFPGNTDAGLVDLKGNKDGEPKSEKEYSKFDKDYKYDKQKGSKKKDLKKKGGAKDGKNVELDDGRKYYTDVIGKDFEDMHNIPETTVNPLAEKTEVGPENLHDTDMKILPKVGAEENMTEVPGSRLHETTQIYQNTGVPESTQTHQNGGLTENISTNSNTGLPETITINQHTGLQENVESSQSTGVADTTRHNPNIGLPETTKTNQNTDIPGTNQIHQNTGLPVTVETSQGTRLTSTQNSDIPGSNQIHQNTDHPVSIETSQNTGIPGSNQINQNTGLPITGGTSQSTGFTNTHNSGIPGSTEIHRHSTLPESIPVHQETELPETIQNTGLSGSVQTQQSLKLPETTIGLTRAPVTFPPAPGEQPVGVTEYPTQTIKDKSEMDAGKTGNTEHPGESSVGNTGQSGHGTIVTSQSHLIVDEPSVRSKTLPGSVHDTQQPGTVTYSVTSQSSGGVVNESEVPGTVFDGTLHPVIAGKHVTSAVPGSQNGTFVIYEPTSEDGSTGNVASGLGFSNSTLFVPAGNSTTAHPTIIIHGQSGSLQDGHGTRFVNYTFGDGAPFNGSLFTPESGSTFTFTNYTTTFPNGSAVHPTIIIRGQSGALQDGHESRFGNHTYFTTTSTQAGDAFFGNTTVYKVENGTLPGTVFDGDFDPQQGHYHTFTNSSGTFVYTNATPQPSFVIKGSSGDFGNSPAYILKNGSKTFVNYTTSPIPYHVISRNSTGFTVFNATGNDPRLEIQEVTIHPHVLGSNESIAFGHQVTPTFFSSGTAYKVNDYFSYISKCAAGQFQCVNGTSKRGSACISLSSKCDSINDCSDGSDELGCIENGCPGNFQCSDGTCLKRHLVCNGIVDCSDGSDEKKCESWKCEFDEFQCPSGRCIPVVWQCDNKPDCDNHTDEYHCQTSCGNDEYLCPEGWCIPLTYKCNGIRECNNGEDEQLCDCSHDEFKCQTGGCVAKSQVCNGLDDCPDRSDEWSCIKIEPDTNQLKIRTPSGVYEPVCADNWSMERSDEVCTSLGYSSSVPIEPESNSSITTEKSFYVLKNDTTDAANKKFLVNLRRTNETCASGKLVEITCQEFSCGSRSMTDSSGVEGRLMGGMSVTAGQWPSVALLYNVRNFHSCTANVLTPRWVLASYNCLKMGNKNLNQQDWKLFGGSTIFEAEKENAETRNILSITPHPQVKFNQFLFSNDLALVELDKPLQFSSNLGAVCLPEQEIQPRQICVTAGWGMNSPEDKAIRQQLQYLPVPTMNLTECNSTDHYSGFITEDKICAGYNPAEKSLCYNEEGAPLMCVNDRGEWELQGVLSYHSNCGRGSHPSIFSSITPVRDWIKQTIGNSFERKPTAATKR